VIFMQWKSNAIMHLILTTCKTTLQVFINPFL